MIILNYSCWTCENLSWTLPRGYGHLSSLLTEMSELQIEQEKSLRFNLQKGYRGISSQSSSIPTVKALYCLIIQRNYFFHHLHSYLGTTLDHPVLYMHTICHNWCRIDNPGDLTWQPQSICEISGWPPEPVAVIAALTIQRIALKVFVNCGTNQRNAAQWPFLICNLP